jgi:hypothetical protein
MKAFILLMVYSSLLLLLACAGGISSIFIAWRVHRAILGVLVFFGMLIALYVGGFSCAYLPKLCMNRTTLEQVAGFAPTVFDRGAGENLREVFGDTCFSWFLPLKPSISGFMWSGIGDLDALLASHAVQT